MFSMPPPFALSLSKGKRKVFRSLLRKIVPASERTDEVAKRFSRQILAGEPADPLTK